MCSDLSRSSTFRRFVSLSATKTRQEVEIQWLLAYPKTCTERRFVASFCYLYDSGLEACCAKRWV